MVTMLGGVLDMRGPAFLGLYTVLLVVGWLMGLLLAYALPRWLSHAESGRADELAGAIGPFETAYLSGGLKRLMHAAVASLYRRGCIKPAITGGLQVKEAPPDAVDEVEKDVYAAIRAHGTRKDLKQAAGFRGMVIRDTLLREGMLLELGQRLLIGCCAALPLVSLLVLGIVKMGVGLSRNKPIIFLMLMSIVACVLIAVVFRRVRLTGVGSAVMARLREQRDKRTRSRTDEPGAHAEVAAWACAVFGMGAVGGSMPAIKDYFHPPSNAGGGGPGGGSGVSCGASCGGSGGGGCGGGCGGCGA